MNIRTRLWCEIREAAMLYEPPDHLTEEQLLAIAKRLSPNGPLELENLELWGIDRSQYFLEQMGLDP
jgi:hypothetical protein